MSLSSVLPVLIILVKACVVVVLLLLARGLAWLFHMLVIAPPSDPMRKMPGPDTGALTNHFREVMDPEQSPTTHKEWSEKYGKNFRFHGFGKHDYRLMTLDLRSVSYILNSPVYEKPWQTRSLLSNLLGRGVFLMEGDEHKAQRKIIGPAFTNQAIKAMTPIFFQKAEELRDRWDAQIVDKEDDTTDSESKTPSTRNIFDVSHWVSRATFDVIGLAGFDYEFNSLENETEEVYLAYRKMFDVTDKGPSLRGLLAMYFPIIDQIMPTEASKITSDSLRTIHKAGQALVRNKKTVILAEKSSASEIREKDILSLLIKSNMSNDPSKRLSDLELLEQLSTFLFAGSDSTGLSISYCLHFLSLHPEIETRLRDEILSLPSHSSTYSESSRAPSPTPSEAHSCTSLSSFGSAGLQSDFAHADAIEALPFLDAVVRETLRVCPPAHGTIRTATKDDVIPMSSPVIMRDGTTRTPAEGIPIRKGTYVHIPLEGLNMSEDIWGPDAREFNPDRWSNLPETARAPTHPGLANLMTFSLGPHSCPGWKFSLVEMKLFLAVLLPQFVFAPSAEIRKYNAILTRPYVSNRWSEGSQLPLKVTRYC